MKGHLNRSPKGKGWTPKLSQYEKDKFSKRRCGTCLKYLPTAKCKL